MTDYPDFLFDLVSGRITIFLESDPRDIADDINFQFVSRIGREYLEFILRNKSLINFEGDDDYQRIVRWLVRAFYSCN